jgi:hypothetical protein
VSLLDFNWVGLDTPSQSGQICTDGTYVYLTTQHQTTYATLLWKIRCSDKALIKPDGSVGSQPITLGFTPVSASCPSVATDGTYLLVNAWGKVYQYRCADLSLVGTQTGTDYYIGNEGYFACYHGGYFWLTTNSPSAQLSRITPGDLGSWITVNTGFLGANKQIGVKSDGTNLWLISGTYLAAGVGLRKITTAGAVLASTSGLGADQCWGVAFDLVRGEAWCTGMNLECYLIRMSDCAFIVPSTKAVGTYATSQITGAPSQITGTTSDGGIVVGDYVFIAGYSQIGIQRRRTSDGSPEAFATGFKSGTRFSVEWLLVGSTPAGSSTRRLMSPPLFQPSPMYPRAPDHISRSPSTTRSASPDPPSEQRPPG